MAQKVFNWGILGPGRIAQQFGDGLKVIEDAALYAVASTNPGRAKAFAAKYNGQKTYDSYEALVNDPQVDGVYIATPHRFHYANARLCLEAGKPVLCEKPLTVNAGEMRQLIDLAKNKKGFLMEALWTRYLPVYQQIRQWLKDGAVGEIRLMVSTFGINVPKEQDDRWMNPELAGGTLLDMGVYPISVSQMVMRQAPKSFSAKAVLSDTGVDELTAALFQYGNGVISQFSSNFVSDDANEFFIFGSKGSIRIHAPFWGASAATLTVGDQSWTVNKPIPGGGFEFETMEAMRCIRQGLLESPEMPLSDTLMNIELMDGIRKEIGVKYPFEK